MMDGQQLPVDQVVRRVQPTSGLDFNLMLTDTMYGSPQVGMQLKSKVRSRIEAQEGGNEDPERMDAWELLSFYTRDLRLSNLGQLEMVYCQYYIDLAGDCLREGYMEAFATALARSATVLELCQSKNGFLRRQNNTLRSEQITGELAEKKRLLFMGKKQGG